MLLFIDNYDSFSYNLIQYFQILGETLLVIKNDEYDLHSLSQLSFQRIVISPGPGNPSTAGICNDVILHYGKHIPILGVCLGHQCIGKVFGGLIVKGLQPMHGKLSWVYHSSDGLFKGIPSPFQVTRYHSLVVSNHSFPSCLKITATTDQNEIMAIEHKEYPIFGVQFHPEAILTEYGMDLLKNWLSLTEK